MSKSKDLLIFVSIALVCFSGVQGAAAGTLTDNVNSLSDSELQAWMISQASSMEQVSSRLHAQGVEVSPQADRSFQEMADQIRAQSQSPRLRFNLLKAIENVGLTVLRIGGYAADTATDVLLIAPAEFISNTVSTGISGQNTTNTVVGTSADLTGAAGGIAITTTAAITLNPAAVVLGVGAGIAVQAICFTEVNDFCDNVSTINRSVQGSAESAGTATGSAIHAAAVDVGSGTLYVAREVGSSLQWEGATAANSLSEDLVNVGHGLVSVARFTARSTVETGTFIATRVNYVVASPQTVPRDLGRGVVVAAKATGATAKGVGSIFARFFKAVKQVTVSTAIAVEHALGM